MTPTRLKPCYKLVTSCINACNIVRHALHGLCHDHDITRMHVYGRPADLLPMIRYAVSLLQLTTCEALAKISVAIGPLGTMSGALRARAEFK